MKMKKGIATLILGLSAATLTAQDARQWVENRVWAPDGLTLSLHESVDAETFYDQYQKNREVWDAVFLFLRDTRLDTLSVGERPLAGFGARCLLRITEGRTKPGETPQRLEHHKKYIDLQYNRTGSEQIAWAGTEGATLVTEYDPVRDVAYYTTDRKPEYYRSTPDRFFLCFPSDYHMPSLQDGEVQTVKKLVVKIEYVP
jgi:YhcH/YjgK/YiaL family protein